MFDLRPYFCPKCGSTYYYNECLRAEHKMYCRECSSKKISLNGMVFVMVAATLGVAFTIPYIILKRFEYEVLQFGFVFLPAICGLALVGLLRIIQKKRIRYTAEHQEEADSDAQSADQEIRPDSEVPAPESPEKEATDQRAAENETSPPVDPAE